MNVVTFIESRELLPKSVSCLRNYSVQTFVSDLIAGATVGLVALPLAMAFAISSGMPPQAGIYCAVVAGFLISALGGSKTQIGGPTGAFVVVVSGILAKYGVDGLLMCTLMAGILLVILGITGLGIAVKYIPSPVVLGFTNGIAILIASTQIKDFFGLKMDSVPSEFVARIEAIYQHWNTFSLPASFVALATVSIIIFIGQISKHIPGAIVALVLGTAFCYFAQIPIETIGTKFGKIPSNLPYPHWPTFKPNLVLLLLSPSLTVALLGAIESLLSAVVSDRMSGDKHNPNVELLAQGIANIVSPLFGGLPATGAIARTATNIRAGGKTPVAGMLHAITLLFILIFAAQLATYIPLCILAGILIVVSYHMGEWKEIPKILKLGKADISVWLITLLLTVFADLTVAVQFGMVLAALFYIYKVTISTTILEVTPEYIQAGLEHSLQNHTVPREIRIFKINGPFLFGGTDKLSFIKQNIKDLPKIIILQTRNMTAIDATGLNALEDLANYLQAAERVLIICGMREQPATLMTKASFHHHVGDNNIQPNLKMAIQRANELLLSEAFSGKPK